VRRALALLLLPAWLALAGVAWADVVVLEDGRILVGPDAEATGQGLLLHFEHGDVLLPEWTVHAHLEAEDAAAASFVAQDRAGRHWRSRFVERTPDFTFETTLPTLAFPEYRNAVTLSYRDLTDALGVARPQGSPPKVCMYRTRDDYMQIGGVSGNVQAYFRFAPPLELAFYDDVRERDLCLRGARWTVACYAIRLACPKLDGRTVLIQALNDYFGAGVAETSSTGAVRYGVVDGAYAERLHRELEAGREAALDRLLGKDPRVREAWAWSLVHFLMRDETFRERFQAAWPAFEGRDDEAHVAKLVEVLGLEEPEARAAFRARWQAHVGGLSPRGTVELTRAAEDAEAAGDWDRARAFYRTASMERSRDTAALRGLAGLLDLPSGHSRAALEAWRTVLAKDPLDVEARERTVEILTETGHEAEGQRELALAAEIRAALEREE